MEDEPVRALVVDDEEIAELHAMHLLTELGCEVDSAKTGYDALAKVDNSQYGIIFMDLGLFDIDGFNVAKAMKGKEHLQDVPIVALTAYPQKSVRKKAFSLGFSDFLLKPLTLESCKLLLKKFIKKTR